MASKKTAGKKSTSKSKKAPKVVVTMDESVTAPDEVVSVAENAEVLSRIELGNEVLSSVNATLASMAARGIAPNKIEEAFYLAFQFAFCDFLRVTGFPFDDAVSDLRDMFQRSAEEPLHPSQVN